MNATAVVLAGGKSKRMNTDKALINLGNKTIIESIIDELSVIFKKIILVANEEEKYIHLNKTIINDVYAGLGPMAGIHAALLHERVNQYIFVVGCDMPFIRAELATYLLSMASGYDAVIPRIGKHLQPLAAIYSVDCLPVIDKHVKNAKLKIAPMLSELNVRLVNDWEIATALEIPDINSIFININTIDDLKYAWIWLKKNNKLLYGSNTGGIKKIALGGEVSGRFR